MKDKSIWIARCKNDDSGVRTTHYHRTLNGAKKHCLEIARDYKDRPTPKWAHDEAASMYTWKLINLVFEIYEEELAD